MLPCTDECPRPATSPAVSAPTPAADVMHETGLSHNSVPDTGNDSSSASSDDQVSTTASLIIAVNVPWMQ